jgi:hypothetical protein
MANNEIRVDLVADLKLALNNLGMGKDIKKAFESHKPLVEGIAKSLGLDIGKALASGMTTGIDKGARDAAKVPPFLPPQGPPKSLWDHIKGLGNKDGLIGGFGRYEIGRSAMDALGVGGGVGGRLGGAALAGLGGNVPGLTAAIAGATIAVEGFKVAIHRMIQAAEQGARLYEQSRAIGRSTGQTSLYLKTLGAVGIDEGQAMRLAAYGQFGAGRGGRGSLRGSVSGEMLAAGARGGMSAQEIQQIYNMRREIDEAAQRMTSIANQTAQTARTNFNTVMEWRIFQEEFKGFWQKIAAIFGPSMQVILGTLSDIVDGITNSLGNTRVAAALFVGAIAEVGMIMATVSQNWRLYGSIAGNYARALEHLGRSDSDARRIVGGQRETHFSSLERMGLVIGGHQDKATKYLESIAHSTARMADALVGNMGGGLSRGRGAANRQNSEWASVQLAGQLFASGLNLP